MSDELKRRALNDKELKFNSDIRRLKDAPVSAVPDFQQPLVKDLAPTKINSNEALPMKSGTAFKTDGVVRDMTSEVRRELEGKNVASNVYDAGAMKQEYIKKARMDRLADIAGRAGKKALSVLPLAGVGYAALQGDPAMAASELAGDIPGYEAIRSEDAGQSAGAEKAMLNEHDARVNYDNSQAGADAARVRALKNMKLNGMY